MRLATRRTFLSLVATLLAYAGLLAAADSASAAGPWHRRAALAGHETRNVYPHQMFSNFYVGPAACAGGLPAQLYTPPLPTPPLVGHTYITYQTLLPHELMYKHRRIYYRHNPGEGWVQTKVKYR